MQLVVNRKIVREDIVDKKGNVLGKIEFDPKDSKIMNKLSNIVKDLNNKLYDLKNLKLDKIDKSDIEKAKNSEELLEIGQKLTGYCTAIDLEYEGIKNTIDSLSEVFGEKTMNVITGGSVSLENIQPLIDFVMPYVTEYRKSLTSKYTNDGKNVL